jgi:hypothetical protein
MGISSNNQVYFNTDFQVVQNAPAGVSLAGALFLPGVPGADLLPGAPSPAPFSSSLVGHGVKSSNASEKQLRKQAFFPTSLPEASVMSGISGVMASSDGLYCPDSSWLRGVCSCPAFTRRWVSLSCKRRVCPYCGKLRRRKISARIALGIEVLGGEDGAGWFVGTFDHDVSKREAVGISQQMDQFLIRYFLRNFGFKPERAKTWETTRNGRLHLNLILAPWRYVPQRELSGEWHKLGGGKQVWIERVGAGVGAEVSKANGIGSLVETPEAGRRRLGNYVAKWDQMVLTGRGVSYSKGWPKLRDSIRSPRRGHIQWEWFGNLTEESILHWYETELGHWYETSPGEWCSADGEECQCFEFLEEGVGGHG